MLIYTVTTQELPLLSEIVIFPLPFLRGFTSSVLPPDGFISISSVSVVWQATIPSALVTCSQLPLPLEDCSFKYLLYTIVEVTKLKLVPSNVVMQHNFKRHTRKHVLREHIGMIVDISISITCPIHLIFI